MYSVFTSEVDRNTYEHDTLDCNWLPKGGYMRSVLTPATSVYAYTVTFGWIAGYLVLNLCLYRGYSQGSDFICHLGGVALVHYIPYICMMLWSDYHYKGHSLSGVCIVTLVSIADHLVHCYSIDVIVRVIFVLQTVQHYPEMIVGCIARQSRQIGVFGIFLATVITCNYTIYVHNINSLRE